MSSLLSSILSSLVSSYLGSTISGTGTEFGDTFEFENVYARLVPFVWPSTSTSSSAIAPIYSSGGLVFPYTPTISEKLVVKYDSVDITHSNESYYSYRGTSNVRINLSNCIWTADTFSNAVYMLGVIHFLRTFTYMDMGQYKTGRPPSPMWFSALGNYGYNNAPCLLESADITFPSDVQYVGVPEPGSSEYSSGYLEEDRDTSGPFTWVPTILKIGSISLIRQHAPAYWQNFSLEDYYSGAMLSSYGTYDQDS